jgi:hypothetical protein
MSICKLRAKEIKKWRVHGYKRHKVIVHASMHHVLPYKEADIMFIHILVWSSCKLSLHRKDLIQTTIPAASWSNWMVICPLEQQEPVTFEWFLVVWILPHIGSTALPIAPCYKQFHLSMCLWLSHRTIDC